MGGDGYVGGGWEVGMWWRVGDGRVCVVRMCIGHMGSVGVVIVDVCCAWTPTCMQ